MIQTREPRKICSRIGLALFAMLLVWYVSSYGISWLLTTAAPHLLRSEWAAWMLNSVPLYALGMPVFLLVMRTIPDGPRTDRWLPEFGVKQFALTMVFCLGASYLINIAANSLIVALQEIFGGNGTGAVDDLLGESGILSNFVFGVIVPAIGEEFIFRYMIRRKMRGCSDVQYIFFSGLCFGLFHGNLSQSLFTFVAGTVFAWAYLMTDKIWVPIAMHFILNSISIVLVPLVIRNTSSTVVFFLLILGLVVGGIILFVGYKDWFFGTLQPPTEPGWPYRPWMPRRRTTGGARYAQWYAGYARNAAAEWNGQVPPYPPYPQMPNYAPMAPPYAPVAPPYQPPAPVGWGIPQPAGYYPQPMPPQPQPQWHWGAQQAPYAPAQQTYPYPPAPAQPYGQLYQPQPYAPYQPPAVHPQPAHGAPAWSGESTVKVSVLNLGMILFSSAAFLLVVFNLLVMVLA